TPTLWRTTMRLMHWIGIGLLSAALGSAIPPRASADPATSTTATSTTAMPEHSMPNMGGDGSTKLFDNFGTWHRAISSKSPEAQKYFDQGLRQLYGFEMQGAERSFRKAAEADSICAACWWGVAMSLGPHVNVPAMPDRTHQAYLAVQKASTLTSGASD